MPISSVGRTNRGITLIEMMVVVTIIGLVVGLSFPSIASGLDSVRLRSATDSIASFLNSAVTRVERQQQGMELVVSVKDNTMILYSTEPGHTRELKLPDGIKIEAVLPPVEEDDGQRRLILVPGATAPAIGVQVANRHGSRRIVHVDPMTGFPRVEAVENK